MSNLTAEQKTALRARFEELSREHYAFMLWRAALDCGITHISSQQSIQIEEYPV